MFVPEQNSELAKPNDEKFDFLVTKLCIFKNPKNIVFALNKLKIVAGAWIVKPVASSRGRGIFIVNHPNQVQSKNTNNKLPNTNAKTNTNIINIDN